MKLREIIFAFISHDDKIFFFLNFLIPIFENEIFEDYRNHWKYIYTDFWGINSSRLVSFLFLIFKGFFLVSFYEWRHRFPDISRSFQRRHLHVAAVISFPTWKSSLLLVCFLPSCVILRGKVCLTNLGASYLTAANQLRESKF